MNFEDGCLSCCIRHYHYHYNNYYEHNHHYHSLPFPSSHTPEPNHKKHHLPPLETESMLDLPNTEDDPDYNPVIDLIVGTKDTYELVDLDSEHLVVRHTIEEEFRPNHTELFLYD